MSAELLLEHRAVWNRKAVLRRLYDRYYARLLAHAVDGASLEIGGGPGNLKAHRPDLLSIDLIVSDWLDAAADAHALPFRDGQFGNLLAVDVLHHLEHPARFLAEAERVLAPGGRLLLIEPAITALSSPLYRCLHSEPVDMSVDPLAEVHRDPGRAPFDANQAIPTLLFRDGGGRLEGRFPHLELARLEYFDLFAFACSGGFQRWSLLPEPLFDGLMAMEDRLPQWLLRRCAFRLFAVIART